MYQTGYAGITTLSYGLPYTGGFCQWWYTAKENMLNWPAVDPLSQFLISEPTLIEGATWLGPVKVPDHTLGFEEPIKRSQAGIFYNQKVIGLHPGDDAFSRINIGNMPYHEYVIVGKVRAGGFFLVLGNNDRGFKFDPDYSSGEGIKGIAGSKFSFTKQSLYKGDVLLSFSASPNTPPPGWYGVNTSGGIIDDGTNKTEIIPFDTETIKTFDWTQERKDLFGAFPLLQVWKLGPPISYINVAIIVDAAPPDQTQFTVYTPGVPGFIAIK